MTLVNGHIPSMSRLNEWAANADQDVGVRSSERADGHGPSSGELLNADRVQLTCR
jgi:hypothetical protein